MLLLLAGSSFFFFNSFDILQNNKGVAKKVTDENFLESLLSKHPQQFQKILANPKMYEVQIIYTQINRDVNNVPSFKEYTYHLQPNNYFYPASLVKLPCSALALEKINNLNIKNLDKSCCMQTDSGNVCQKKITKDSSAKNNIPSVAQYIRRMLLVSDNEAYGRIYEFLGQEYISEQLTQKGYPDVRIIHRFDVNCNIEQNKCTNPISFFDGSGKCLYKQDMQTCIIDFTNPSGGRKKGNGYLDANEKLVHQPWDYTNKNCLNLQDETDILKSIMFPEGVAKEKRFNLTQDDYTFLYRYLSMYPRESDYPKYDEKNYYDGYKKYFMYGTNHKRIETDSVRLFNIVGAAYGYLADCAYIVNYDHKIEFMLSATIYVNKDGIVNDGKYEYYSVGFPFMSDLGNMIYNYEFKRKKNYLPNLSNFKLR